MQTFRDYVRDTLQHVDDGLITETEMAAKIAEAAAGKFSSVSPPTNDTDELGIDPAQQLGGE